MNESSTPPRDPVAALPFVRAAVKGLGPSRAPLIEADAREAGVAAPVLRRLNLNEGPFAPSPKAIAAICEAASSVNRYPDPKVRRLAAVIAERTGVDRQNIVFGNGSDELIQLVGVMALEPGTSVVLPAPSFPRYLHAAKVAGATPIVVPVRADGANDVEAMLGAIRTDTKVVYCATPNNPTGAMLDRAALDRLVTGVPASVLLVIDEAYFEFARHAGGPDALEAVARRTGPWAILRTLSKAYGLAGLRVGYGLCADPAIAGAIARVRGTFSVNAIAQAAAIAALEDEAHTRNLLDACARERERLAAGFRRLGCTPLPSAANFVSARLPIPASDAVRELMKCGILVGAIGPAPFERHIRVTIGSAEDTDAFLAALTAILGA